MTAAEREKFSHKMRWLAQGTNTEARWLKRYVTNDFKFRIKGYDKNKTTQNSGVSVVMEGDTSYYSLLTYIIELNYFDNFRYILFKCDWADLSGKGYKIDKFGFPLVNFSHLIYVRNKLSDEHFIIASQAS